MKELIARALREIDEGALPSCQLALALEGELVAFEALGGASKDSRYVVYSVTKALTAGLIWILVGDGLIEYATRVAELAPEFGTNGKDTVTVEHLLLHTSGFPHAPMHPLEGADRARRLERFASWRLDWEPGTRTEYHPTSAHWVLADVADRVAGDYRKVFAERVAHPLGLPRLELGVAKKNQGDVADVVVVGEDVRAVRSDGTEIPLPEINSETLLRFNDPEVRAVGVPGAGAIGTAADVAMYFQALLQNPSGLWHSDVLQDGTGVIRNVYADPYTHAPANRTRGLVVAGGDEMAFTRGFGRNPGTRAFASPGVGGQVAWADPDSGLSFCFLTNGIDADLVAAFRRSLSLSSRAEGCVT